MRSRKSPGWLLALLICGCSNGSDANRAIDVKLTQKPEQAYTLDFEFDSAPGALENIRALAFYRADNSPCAKPLPTSGAVLPPEHNMWLKLKKTDVARYQAMFHRDALIDEDYFGIGMCRWRLQNIAVYFSSPTTDFVAPLSMPGTEFAQVRAEHFFLNRDFAEKPSSMTIVFGEKAGFYRPVMGDQFKLTVTAKRQ